MRLFRRRLRPPAAATADEPAETLLHCSSCGAPLSGDPDDEPDGEGPGRHLCGECRRGREFDTLAVELGYGGADD